MALSGSITTNSYNGRYYTLSWSAKQSIPENRSTIKWTLSCAGGSSSWYAERTLVVTLGGNTLVNKTTRVQRYAGTISSGTIYIDHNSVGDASISGSIRAAVYTSSVNCTKNGSWPLDTIPRKATISSAPDFNDEENPVLKYSNPAGTAVTTLQACISLDGSAADISYRDISKSGTSYTFKLTDAERNVLRKATTSSNTRTVKFYIKTIIGGTTFYSNVAKTLTIINSKPEFSSYRLSYADTNTAVTEVTNNDQMIVQNKSNLVVTYKAATAQKYATISKYSFTLNGTTKTSTAAGGTIDFGKINSDQDLTLSVTVTDSRGNTVSASETITCYKYYSPYFIDFKAYRADENGQVDLSGTYLKCEYTTNIASVDGTNARTVSIVGVGSDPISASGNSVLIDLNGDKDTTYKVYAIVNDLFGGTNNSEVYTIFGDVRIMNITPSGTGIAFGKKAEKDKFFECRWPASFNGVPLPEIQSGSVKITPTAADTPTSASVTFDIPFTDVPNVVVTPQTTAPGTTVLGVGTASITKTGCKIYVTRTNTTTTTVHWIAINNNPVIQNG